MKKTLIFAFLLVVDAVFAQTYCYKHTKEFDADGIPFSYGYDRNKCIYYTFNGSYFYSSDENGNKINSTKTFVYDGKKNENGYLHYVAKDETPLWYSGEFLISEDRTIIYFFCNSFTQRLGVYVQELKRSNPSSPNNELP